MWEESIHLSNGDYYANAIISWDEDLTVTVEITSANTGWRITGKYSEGDRTQYLSGSASAQTKTFSGKKDKTYVFGIYVAVEETYYNDSGSEFTVSLDDDSGDDSGGGGDDSGESANILYISQAEGTEIKVERTWSDAGDYTIDENYPVYLSDGDTIYYDADRFKIEVKVLPGYELTSYDDNTGDYFTSTNLTRFWDGEDGIYRYKLTSNDDVYINTSATPIATIRIYNEASSSWDKYAPYVYSENSGWERYTPYIYSADSAWERYS